MQSRPREWLASSPTEGTRTYTVIGTHPFLKDRNLLAMILQALSSLYQDMQSCPFVLIAVAADAGWSSFGHMKLSVCLPACVDSR